MEGYKVSIWNVVKIAGAWISFCIGSAFATGQSILQYYCGFGVMAYAAILVSMSLHAYMAVSFLKLGTEHPFKNSMEIFDYYCGKKIGILFKTLTIIFMFLSPTCMIAGFGATLNEYFAVPNYVGTFIMGVLCLITVLLGLKKLVNIVGAVGPVIIVLTLLIGGTSIAANIDGFAEGVKLSSEIPILQYSSSWFVSGLLDASWAPLIIGPFMISCATQVKMQKEAVAGGVLGIIGYGLATAVMITAFYCQYADVSQQMVPTLYLVSGISKVLAAGFVTIIFLGIYSSAVPSQFNFCAAFFPEKSKKYNVTAIISILFATAGSLILPFNKLLNIVYSFFGYASWGFLAFMVLKQVRNFIYGKKSII